MSIRYIDVYVSELFFLFSKLYLTAKARVAKMPVRVIEINDPIVQTIFEVYAVMHLDTTEYNDFDTH